MIGKQNNADHLEKIDVFGYTFASRFYLHDLFPTPLNYRQCRIAALNTRAATGEHGMANSLLPLDTLGKQIKVRIEKGDKATVDADGHYMAAGIDLIEAKQRVQMTKGTTWPAFLIKHCSIGRRRADQLIANANGTKPLADVREATRTAMAATRAKSASRDAQLSKKDEQEQDPPSVLVGDTSADLYILRKWAPRRDTETAQQYWERQLSYLASGAVIIPDLWTAEFTGEWETFEASPAVRSYPQEAAEVWAKLAANLTKRHSIIEAIAA